MKFQSLGSNYSFGDAWRMLVSRGSESDSHALITWLEKRYGGIAILYDKGRDALSASLSSSGIKRVAINGVTCSVVVEAALTAKSEIIYLDVEHDGNFSAETLQAALASDTPPQAIVIQNTYGYPSDISSIEQLARAHNLVLIEDLAHSLGQTYADGREVGTIGDIVMLSFGRDKVVDVVNGGALIIREPSLLKGLPRPTKFRAAKVQFRDRIYPLLTCLGRALYGVVIGKAIIAGMYRFHLAEHSADGGIHTEFTMPHWQAKLLLRQLTMLDKNVAHRKEIAQIYANTLPTLVIAKTSLIRTPLWVTDRAKVIAALAQNGFQLADTWYDVPIGPKRKFETFDYSLSEHPGAVDLAHHVINLPTHRGISPSTARKIAEIVKEAA